MICVIECALILTRPPLKVENEEHDFDGENGKPPAQIQRRILRTDHSERELKQNRRKPTENNG